MTSADSDAVVDGRRLRRVRSRDAVVDAMIDLVLEAHELPGVGRVAERAGVSEASLFRYFDTLDDLRRAAIARYFERFDDLIAIPEIGDGAVAERIDRFVAARDAFYARTAPMARITRRHAHDIADLADNLDRLRATFADQIAQHFAPELGSFRVDEHDQLVAVIAALTSFESWDQLATLGAAARRSAWCRAIQDLLIGR